jgi:hypothetical protein
MWRRAFITLVRGGGVASRPARPKRDIVLAIAWSWPRGEGHMAITVARRDIITLPVARPPAAAWPCAAIA